MAHLTLGSSPTARRGRRQWFTVPLSMLVHTTILGSLVVVPLVATGALPTPRTILNAIVVVQPPPAPPPPPRNAPPPIVVEATADLNVVPLVAPDGFTPEPMRSVVVLASPVPIVSAPRVELGPPPPAPPAAPSRPPRPGGLITEPRKIHHVAPAYPAIARAARAEGVVIIEAIIATDGSVRDARILRSHALLDDAALAAVREWRYSPSLLGGTPIEVLVSVTVSFALR